jgi:hypothetical protein
MRFKKLSILLLAVSFFTIGTKTIFSQSSSPVDVQLSNGVAVDGSVNSGFIAQSGWTYYYITIPAGTANTNFQLYNLSKDADLYVRAGSKPTTTSYTCRSQSAGTTAENCLNVVTSAGGTWYIGVNGVSTGITNFTVKATYSTAVPDPSPAGNPAIYSRAGGSLRNNYGGDVGFSFTAATNAYVTHLGRWTVLGNTGTHTVKILNSSLNTLGSVSINTASKAPGYFAYAELGSPVQLVAGQKYYIYSGETAGGDQWYHADQTISENTSLVTSMTSSYGSGTPDVGKSHVPVNFYYTTTAPSTNPSNGSSPTPSPSASPSGEAALLSRSGGTLRNDYSGNVGFKFTAAADGEVTHLGVWVVGGNTGTKTIRILNSFLIPLGSVTITTADKPAGYYAYAPLTNPVTLVKDQTYFVYTTAVAGGDRWYNLDQTISQNTNVMTSIQASYGNGSTDLGKAYVPVNFYFNQSTIDTDPPNLFNIEASNITYTSATITWQTNENSTSQVRWGLTNQYGNTSTLNSNMVTNHSVNITGLQANRAYHYQVLSRDAAGNLATSEDQTFYVGTNGWAWSSTIGWIQFATGSREPVILDEETGYLTGYAWSSNIGWIKFGGLSGFPPGGTSAGNAKVLLNPSPSPTPSNYRAVEGWVRACAGTASGDCSSMTPRTDGWDGWIELSGANHISPVTNGTGGVTYYDLVGLPRSYLKGFAWGSDVVGWIDFNTPTPVCVRNCGITFDPTPKCEINAVVSGENIEVSYKIENDINNTYRLVRTRGSTNTTLQNNISTGPSSPKFGNYTDTGTSPSTEYGYTLSRSGGTSCQLPPNPDLGGRPTIRREEYRTGITMWLNGSDLTKESIVIRSGSPADVYWRNNANTAFNSCIAFFDGEQITKELWDVDFFTTGRDRDGNTDNGAYSPNSDGPFTIPPKRLSKGTHKFTMQCKSPNSLTYDVIGKTGVTNSTHPTELIINVTESSIKEQ